MGSGIQPALPVLAISENAQGAFLLRPLLLGRQFQHFGKLEFDLTNGDSSICLLISTPISAGTDF